VWREGGGCDAARAAGRVSPGAGHWLLHIVRKPLGSCGEVPSMPCMDVPLPPRCCARCSHSLQACAPAGDELLHAGQEEACGASPGQCQAACLACRHAGRCCYCMPGGVLLASAYSIWVGYTWQAGRLWSEAVHSQGEPMHPLIAPGANHVFGNLSHAAAGQYLGLRAPSVQRHTAREGCVAWRKPLAVLATLHRCSTRPHVA
jgi:hypothetical protein